MTAPVRIEAEAWSDLRFATLARLMGFADLDHALIKCSRIWSWQTEHYTPDEPTYVVDADLIESALGLGGAAAMVRARLAEEVPTEAGTYAGSKPGGFRIRGSRGRIEWLWQRREASARGGEARKRIARDKTKPGGSGPGYPTDKPGPEPKPSPLVPALSPDLPEDQNSPPRAIRPDLVPAPPSAVVYRDPRPPNVILPLGEAPMLWRELEQARAEAAAELHVDAMPLAFGDVGERDLADLTAAARRRGPAELDKFVRQARHAIAMAKLETATGQKPFEWFTGAVFSANNFRRLVGKTATATVRAGPGGSAARAPEPIRNLKTL